MGISNKMDAFYTQNMTEPLSSSAIALWFALLQMNKWSGWKKQFAVQTSNLRLMAGLSSCSFDSARQELQMKGRNGKDNKEVGEK